MKTVIYPRGISLQLRCALYVPEEMVGANPDRQTLATAGTQALRRAAERRRREDPGRVHNYYKTVHSAIYRKICKNDSIDPFYERFYLWYHFDDTQLRKVLEDYAQNSLNSPANMEAIKQFFDCYDRTRKSVDEERRETEIAGSMPQFGGVEPPEVTEAEVAIAVLSGKTHSHQGFRIDPTERRAIEDRAMTVAERGLQDLGWSVRNVSSRKSYDLECTGSAGELHVEVKGTTSDGSKVLLTRNELEYWRDHPDKVALVVVSGIQVIREAGRPPVAAGGNPSWHWPPMPIFDTLLRPLGWEYTVTTIAPGTLSEL